MKRILALDIRPRKLGFVVFESPARLVNWGIKLIPATDRTTVALADLMALSRPSLVVIRDDKSVGQRRAGLKDDSTVRLIQAALRRRSAISGISANQQWRFFQQYEAKTKHQIATLLAKVFPELAWQLPHPRRPWETEHWHMPIFDAAALGVTHLGLRVDPEGTADLLSS